MRTELRMTASPAWRRRRRWRAGSGATFGRAAPASLSSRRASRPAGRRSPAARPPWGPDRMPRSRRSRAARPASAAERATPRSAPSAPPRPCAVFAALRADRCRSPAARATAAARLRRPASRAHPPAAPRGPGALLDVGAEQAQRGLALRDPIVQRGDIQARGLGIQAGQPQRRGGDVIGGQSLRLAAEGRAELEVLRLDPPHGFGDIARHLPGLLDLARQPGIALGIGGGRDAGDRRPSPYANAQSRLICRMRDQRTRVGARADRRPQVKTALAQASEILPAAPPAAI